MTAQALFSESRFIRHGKVRHPSWTTNEGANMNVIEMVRETLSQAVQRSTGNVRGPSGINVNEVERVASLVLGGVLIAGGLKQRSVRGTALAIAGGGLVSRGITGHSTLYRKLNLHTAGGRKLRPGSTRSDEMEITRAITVGKPAEELHRLWRDPQVLPRVMEEFAEVIVRDQTHAHWIVHGPMDRRIEWDTEIVDELPGELIRWRAQTGTRFPNEGSLQFRPAPGDRGTELLLRMHFSPPGGMHLDGVIKLLGFVPKQMAYKALFRFKSLAETGEIPSIKNQPAGRNDGRDR
jgi:uncharacterized membrane protein